MDKSKVYFTKEITPLALIKIYKKLGKELNGSVAVKISTGEPGGHNYLKPELIKDLVSELNGTIVECNTAYSGRRNTTSEHLKTIKEHGFTKIANVDIMDSEGDMELKVNGGKYLKVNYVGANLSKYDSMLMLSHFKGHQMGGFGGALKNMSIGIASSRGKAWIHSAGTSFTDYWHTPQEEFISSMAEADKSVIDYMNGNILYINVMNNLSVDCDCNSNPEEPCMEDIGILASCDPVALDKACVDLIYNSNDKGKEKMIERIESRKGKYILEYASNLGLGNLEYDICIID